MKAVSLPCRTVRYGTVQDEHGPNLRAAWFGGLDKARSPTNSSGVLYGIVSDRTIRYLPALFIVEPEGNIITKRKTERKKEKKAKEEQ